MAEEIVPVPHPEGAAEQAPAAPLESDLDRLAGEIAAHKENPEMAGASEHELVRQAIRSVSDLPPAPPAPPKPAAAAAAAGDDSALPGYMAAATPAQKLEVEELLREAFKEGIAKATADAQKSNPYILDAFHDALAGKLHEELKKRNIL